jgi:hypothetical protein
MTRVSSGTPLTISYPNRVVHSMSCITVCTSLAHQKSCMLGRSSLRRLSFVSLCRNERLLRGVFDLTIMGLVYIGRNGVDFCDGIDVTTMRNGDDLYSFDTRSMRSFHRMVRAASFLSSGHTSRRISSVTSWLSRSGQSSTSDSRGKNRDHSSSVTLGLVEPTRSNTICNMKNELLELSL